MLSFFKKLFIRQPGIDFAQLIASGAVILDVRTREEFQSGHVKGSVNIPLQILRGNSSRLKKSKPVITCCRSGARSSTARAILHSQGFEVYNGGSWLSLRKYVK